MSFYSYNNSLVLIDINECDSDPFPCGDNSECIDSDGSFSCQCNRMFTGDGTTCKGTVFIFSL